MPYIKREDRSPYDSFVWKIIKALVYDDKKALEFFAIQVAEYLKNQDLKAIDGHFNYFITKLMIDLNWHNGNKPLNYFGTVGSPDYTIIHDFIFEVAKQVYPPKYFNYNRLIGMLTCCREEFKRRYKKKATAVEMLLTSLIKQFYSEIIGPYEDTKIEANGDVVEPWKFEVAIKKTVKE